MEERQRGRPEGRRVVLVPLEPQPLVEVGHGGAGGGDEWDELVDDLLGEADDERPGLADLALLVVGLVVLGWSLRSGSGGFLVAGVVLVVLGSVVPIRQLVRLGRRRRDDRRMEAIRSRGALLDIGEPVVRALVAEHERLRLVAETRHRGDEALTVAHLAVVEVAALLAAAPPDEHQMGFVEERLVVVIAMREALERRAPDGSATGRSAALVAAHRELDDLTGTGSLRRAAELVDELEGGRGPAR